MVINPIIGFYIPIMRIPIKGGMTIPNIATFDHGTYVEIMISITWNLAILKSWRQGPPASSSEPALNGEKDYGNLDDLGMGTNDSLS